MSGGLVPPELAGAPTSPKTEVTGAETAHPARLLSSDALATRQLLARREENKVRPRARF